MLCTIIIFSFTHYVNGCCHSVCLGSERCWWSNRMLPKLLFLSDQSPVIFYQTEIWWLFFSLIWWQLTNESFGSVRHVFINIVVNICSGYYTCIDCAAIPQHHTRPEIYQIRTIRTYFANFSQKIDFHFFSE